RVRVGEVAAAQQADVVLLHLSVAEDEFGSADVVLRAPLGSDEGGLPARLASGNALHGIAVAVHAFAAAETVESDADSGRTVQGVAEGGSEVDADYQQVAIGRERVQRRVDDASG